MTKTPPRVSVVIATFNRAALLDECLTHLRTQPFTPGDDVIVVDNGSTDDTAAIVQRQQAAWTTPLRLLHESRPGKSHAIARAVGDATGDVLVFSDDDVNVGAGWLDALREAMADPAVALAGGPVVARWESTVPQWIRGARERHPRLGAPIALLDYGDRSLELGPRTLLGANLAIRRDVFTTVGGFPTHLASFAARSCRARTTSCAGRSRRSGSALCTSPRLSFTIGCRRLARACRTFCNGFSGRASRTRSWTATTRRRDVGSGAFRCTSFGEWPWRPPARWLDS